jgi:hypothetical protein
MGAKVTAFYGFPYVFATPVRNADSPLTQKEGIHGKML